MNALSSELSDRLIDGLAQTHYCALDGALPRELLADLRKCAAERAFKPARIGRAGTSEPSIRNDEICWIDAADLRPPERALFELFESLRQRLNRELFLGLKDFEAHYARYEAGHFYARHLDRFNDDSARTISVVLYLNKSWSPEDGGQLRLHVAPEPVDVLPRGGTLVCFTSADIEHEVLPARRERMSIAAWFRR